jgi:mono/diheme cytochrome c family protein
MALQKKEEEKSYAFHFFLLSGLLILFSLLVLWEEVIALRPWKTYQKEYYALRYDITAKELQRAEEELKKPKVQKEYQNLKTILEKKEKEFKKLETQKEYQKLIKMIGDIEEDITHVQSRQLIARNKLLEQEYQYIKYKREKNKKQIDDLKEEIRILEDQQDKASHRKNDLKRELDDLTLPLNEYREKLKLFPYTSRIEELERLLKSLKSPKPEIKQYYIESLDKVDRCTSCHMEIENPSQKAYPAPYTTHPGSFIFIKNHPPQQFGCTICHQGQGRATSAIEKAHGRVEFWAEPMFKGQHAQASCQHCHQDISGLKGAEALKEGDKILKRSVCFGCHRIDGYENMVKISPPLSRIGEKINYTWLVKWLMNPSQMMVRATMPNYNFTEEEAQAIADYLFSLTQNERNDESVREEPNWDLHDYGKIIYSQSICSICHSANGRGGAFQDMYAPDLSTVGSKVKKEWIKNWFKIPKNYFVNARMSHYRFTEKEIVSLSEYLRGEYVDWDLEDLKLKQPSSLKEQSIQEGAALIKEYGCFGCHDIQGMRDIQQIGPYLKIDQLEEMVADELTSFADKPLQEFDFGKLVNIPKTRADYLREKLADPRAFRDDAKMPEYNLSDDELDHLNTLVLGFSREEPLARYRVERNESDYQPTGEFAVIVDDLKCLNCHMIYEKGADYGPDLSIEGSRVKGDWLENYLKTPDIIRPLSEQMPKFNLGRDMKTTMSKLSKNEIDILSDYILTILVSDEIPKNLLEGEDISVSEVERGRELYLQKGCQACHQIGAEGGAVGPTLTSVGSRLTPGYIYKHLLNPKIANKATREPNLGLTEDEALILTKFLISLNLEQ